MPGCIASLTRSEWWCVISQYRRRNHDTSLAQVDNATYSASVGQRETTDKRWRFQYIGEEKIVTTYPLIHLRVFKLPAESASTLACIVTLLCLECCFGWCIPYDLVDTKYISTRLTNFKCTVVSAYTCLARIETSGVSMPADTSALKGRGVQNPLVSGKPCVVSISSVYRDCDSRWVSTYLPSNEGR